MRRGDLLVAALVVAAPGVVLPGCLWSFGEDEGQGRICAALLRFFRLGLLFLGAICVSAWLLGCGATPAYTQTWAQATPNGKRLFRICRRHPQVDSNARYWYDRGDGTPRTTSLPLDALLESREAKAIFILDASAPPESRKLLGIAFQDLPCDKPPPPPPAPEKLAAKEKEGEPKKDEARKDEPPKPLPRPNPRGASAVERRVEVHRCTAYVEPGQTRRRSKTGGRTCTRILLHRGRGDTEPIVAENQPRPVEAPVPAPSQVPPGEVWRYDDGSLPPEEMAQLERAYECLQGVCHARHKNFQEGKNKPAGTHNGQSLSTGSGGGASPPQPPPKTKVRTKTRTFGKPNGAKPNGAAAGEASPANTGAAANERRVPNPNGRNGGDAHQAKVREVTENVKKRGLEPAKEDRVKTPGGHKENRYVDVAGKRGNEVVERHQVGKQTKDGQPVARERQALDDVERATGERPTFHPYNKEK
ncbi:hypothetical protein [Polyangium fumosum]|uniref:Uncharacterized protein n=1 Tax=Polyangium fumosum TaxID=889272 RepID=A0A4U1IVI2_9BACT|nr:hypothetical protein [Polyangium fumosum]TKC98507.1 hypothetical protein E8A74_40825 [Polyangium fumosum]